MDVFAHWIWAYLASKFANLRLKKKLKNWLTALFGILPDIISFTPLFAWLIVGLITGTSTIGAFPHPVGIEPAARDTLFIFKLTGFLYSAMHSMFVFLAVFLLCWLIFRKPILELLGWLLHIVIDIPTHSYQFYPTPFLWPLSEYKFNGISWGTPWFMIANYSAILIFYLWIRKKK